jgi:hypothetical protein
MTPNSNISGGTGNREQIEKKREKNLTIIGKTENRSV